MPHLRRFAFIVALMLGSCPSYGTLLDHAAQTGDLGLARALIMDDPSSINVKDQNGSTPLALAAQEGHLEMVRLLVEKGARVDARANYRGAPLSTAAFYSDPATIKLLLIKAPVDDIGATPLYIAAKEDHLAVAQVLLENGAAVDVGAEDGCTALYVASQEGHLDVVRLLLAKGAAIEGNQKDGVTPLAVAAQYAHPEVVKLLLEKGAAVDAKDVRGFTPLARAAQDADGHLARHLQVMGLLLERGANPDTLAFSASGGGKSALQAAEDRADKAIAELLREASAKQKAKQTRPSLPVRYW